MRRVLNLPVPSHQLQETRWGCPFGAQTGDSIDHFSPFLPRLLDEDMTPHLKDLGQTRPVTVAYQSFTRGEKLSRASRRMAL